MAQISTFPQFLLLAGPELVGHQHFLHTGDYFLVRRKAIVRYCADGYLQVFGIESGAGSIERSVWPMVTLTAVPAGYALSESERLARDLGNSFPSTYPSGIYFDSLAIGVYHWRFFTDDSVSTVLWHYGLEIRFSFIVPLAMAIAYWIRRRRDIWRERHPARGFEIHLIKNDSADSSQR